ncbi:MAG: TIM barrel protein [Hyphomicrobiales bacterium]
MTKFSANLGFLWSELSLVDGIRAAKLAGFDAVECHWPYETPPQDVADVLEETGLVMLGLNTVCGGENEKGLSALPGREQEAREAIDQAIAYARAIDAKNIHVMAGFASGVEAQATFIENLEYACMGAKKSGITILIEPLNHYDAPGYFLTNSSHAKEIIESVGASNLKLMYDCYHMQIMEGDLSRRLTNLLPIIGHIQIAGVPERGPPDSGEIAYTHLYKLLDDLGYSTPLGAEYRPLGSTEESLDWLAAIKDNVQ